MSPGGEKSPQLRTMIPEQALEHLRALGHSRILWKGGLTLLNSLGNLHAHGQCWLPVPFFLLLTTPTYSSSLHFASTLHFHKRRRCVALLKIWGDEGALCSNMNMKKINVNIRFLSSQKYSWPFLPTHCQISFYVT